MTLPELILRTSWPRSIRSYGTLQSGRSLATMTTSEPLRRTGLSKGHCVAIIFMPVSISCVP